MVSHLSKVEERRYPHHQQSAPYNPCSRGPEKFFPDFFSIPRSDLHLQVSAQNTKKKAKAEALQCHSIEAIFSDLCNIYQDIMALENN